MIFSIVVYATPYSSQAASTALQYCEELISQEHQIHRVFFYGDGVQAASALSCPQQDEIQLHNRWQQLAEQHDLDLVVCIAAAAKRGVIDQNEAKRYGRVNNSLGDRFTLSGLGQLVEAGIVSDRVVTFGESR